MKIKSRLTNTENINNYFASVADAYDAPINQPFYTDVARRLCCIILKNGLKPKRILEIGCGSGFATREIVNYFPHASITAIDPVAELLAMARSKVGGCVDFINQSYAGFAYEKQADLIIANMSYHWLSKGERLKLAAEIKAGANVALAAPLRTNHSSAFLGRKYSGNRVLLQAFRALAFSGDIDIRDKSWRGLEPAAAEKLGFELKIVEEHKVIEFMAAPEFIKVLSSRGLLPALFGDGADAAQLWISKYLSHQERLALAWPLVFCLATSHTAL